MAEYNHSSGGSSRRNSIPLPIPMPTRRSTGSGIPTTSGGISGVLKRLSYDYTDSVSRVSIIRQFELYSLPQLNESSDLFTLNQEVKFNTHGNTETQVDSEDEEEVEETDFWTNILNDFHNEVIKNGKVIELELEIINGIPPHLRGAIYMKFLHIRYKFNSKESYEGLLRRARMHTDSYVERLVVDNKNVLKVFNYYINEISNRIDGTSAAAVAAVSGHEDDIQSEIPPNTFIIHIYKILETIPGIKDEEIFFMLLKFNKLFHYLIKDEFFYKLNRSMEDLLGDVFAHVNVQGVNLINFYKKVLFNFFGEMIADLNKLLDFVVFEGFDLILRLIVWIFHENKEKIMKLKGDPLNDFINSKEFFTPTINWELILIQSPQIIKYENEYHLININSLNNNELRNLKEVNYDLNLKVNEFKKQLTNLETIHTEILDQNESINVDLIREQSKRDELVAFKAQLESQYENLIMKENLKNTVKANLDFAIRNKEMEDSIAELRLSIEEKKSKLANA